MELVRVKGATKRLEKPRSLTMDQFLTLVSHLKQPHRTMVLVAGCMGLRVSELMALKWTDFDLADSTVLVQRSIVHGRVGEVKTEYSSERVPVDALLAKELVAYRLVWPESADGWLFANPATGKPYHSEEVQKSYLRKAGLLAGLGSDIGWHTFRHSYRAWLDDTGAPMGVQQELMRHASITTTMNVYGSAMSSTKREANAKVVRMLLKIDPPTDKAQLQAAG